MKDSWKIAALLAACGALGLAGCAGDTAAAALESGEATASLGASLTTEEDVDQDADMDADEDTAAAAEALRPRNALSPSDDIEEAVGSPILPALRPPRCPARTRRVQVPGGGFRCRGLVPGFSAPPFCPPSWRLVPRRGGFLCARHGLPPLRPLPAETTQP